jgi:hypothetical protein
MKTLHHGGQPNVNKCQWPVWAGPVCEFSYIMIKWVPSLCLAGILFLIATNAGAAQVNMSGHVDYTTYGSRVRLFVEEINNLSDVTTDRLRLRLWASEDHWDPLDRGRLVAFLLLPRLYPYQHLHDVSHRVLLDIPPSGWYHVTLTLEERVIDETGKHWELRDVVEFDGEHYFRRNFVGWPFPH